VAEAELRAPFPPLVLDPVFTSSAYVAGRRLYHTIDGGDTWTALAEVDPDPTHVVIALAIAPASRTTLFAATACLPEVALVSCPAVSLVWRSANGGQTWVQMSPVAGLINRLAIDPRQSFTVYAAIGAFPAGSSRSAGLVSGDLLRSTNAGAAWFSIRGNLPQVPVNTILIDPASLPAQFFQPAQKLYVGTDAGVFVSFNAGVQWIDISGTAARSLPPSPITGLSLRQSDGILLAATFGRGIYWTSTVGLNPGVVANPLSVEVALQKETAVTTGVALTNLSPTAPFGWLLNPLDSWISVTEASGSLRQLASSPAAIRVSAAGLEPGLYVGRLQLVSGDFVQNVVVRARVTPPPARITIIGGIMRQPPRERRCRHSRSWFRMRMMFRCRIYPSPLRSPLEGDS